MIISVDRVLSGACYIRGTTKNALVTVLQF